MVTTNCLELTGSGQCTVPLKGNTLDELKNNIFSHAKQDHADQLAKMSPQDQANIQKRIEEVWQSKSGSAAAR